MAYIPEYLHTIQDIQVRPRVYIDTVVDALNRVNRNFAAIQRDLQAVSTQQAWQTAVLTTGLINAPTQANVADRFLIINEPPTGDPWDGHRYDIARVVSVDPVVWAFDTPDAGWRLCDISSNTDWVYTGEYWVRSSGYTIHELLLGLYGGNNEGHWHLTHEEYVAALGAIGMGDYSPKALCAQFDQDSPTSHVIGTIPPDAIITRIVCTVITASITGSPTISIGTATDAERFMATTEVTLDTTGIYEQDFQLVDADGGEDLEPVDVYLFITADSAEFEGNLFIKWEKAEWSLLDGGII